VKKGELRIHFGLVLAEAMCIPAFVFEFYRARHGNLLSWAYVIEWPILGSYAVYMWAKLLREERGTDRRSRDQATRQVTQAQQEADDPELRAWNDYLAKVHGTDTSVED